MQFYSMHVTIFVTIDKDYRNLHTLILLLRPFLQSYAIQNLNQNGLMVQASFTNCILQVDQEYNSYSYSWVLESTLHAAFILFCDLKFAYRDFLAQGSSGWNLASDLAPEWHNSKEMEEVVTFLKRGLTLTAWRLNLLKRKYPIVNFDFWLFPMRFL